MTRASGFCAYEISGIKCEEGTAGDQVDTRRQEKSWLKISHPAEYSRRSQPPKSLFKRKMVIGRWGRSAIHVG